MRSDGDQLIRARKGGCAVHSPCAELSLALSLSFDEATSILFRSPQRWWACAACRLLRCGASETGPFAGVTLPLLRTLPEGMFWT